MLVVGAGVGLFVRGAQQARFELEEDRRFRASQRSLAEEQHELTSNVLGQLFAMYGNESKMDWKGGVTSSVEGIGWSVQMRISKGKELAHLVVYGKMSKEEGKQDFDRRSRCSAQQGVHYCLNSGLR